MLLRIGVILGVCCSMTAQSKDLGVYGEVFPIKENSLIDVLLKKMKTAQQSGLLEDLQKKLQEQTKTQLDESFERREAPRATQYRAFLYDPTLKLGSDLKDHQGKVFAKKGDTFNPLDQISWGDPLIFVDGHDLDQVQWALPQKGKILLVRGHPIKQEELSKRPIYFDQQRLLSSKFKIKAYPAKVSQKGRVLLVEEFGTLNETNESGVG